MGQYYYIVNLDKKQYLHPHQFGNGLKLMEFGCSDLGAMTGLAILLAEGNGRGGGDLDSDNPIIGSWARDRIVVAGDYADDEYDGNTIYNVASDCFEDISVKVILALCDDRYFASEFLDTMNSWCTLSPKDQELIQQHIEKTLSEE
jgi:hypothetical protein